MRAAVLREFGGPLPVETVPDPEPAPDGAVVAVRATGVCRSDWHGWQGHDASIRLPHVPGHELSGVVAAVGRDVRRFAPGDRVTVPFCCGCGRCEPCRAGETQVCDEDVQPGFTIWGAFAELVALPRADLNLVRLPDELGFVEAASLGCRFMTAYAALAVRGRVAADEWVAIHGCGGVGLSAVLIAAALGAAPIVVDIDPGSLALASELGAVAAIDARTADPVAAIHELTRGGAHVSVDALGSPGTLERSVRCLRKRGRHLQVGLLLGDAAVPPVPMAPVLARELELIGVHGMAVRHYDALLALVGGGGVRPGRLVRRRIGLAEAGDELSAMGGFAQRGVTVIDAF